MRDPGVAKERAFSGRSQRGVAAPVVGFFDLSMFLIR